MVETKMIPLGESSKAKVVNEEPQENIDDRIAHIESTVADLRAMLVHMFHVIKDNPQKVEENDQPEQQKELHINKDGLPIGGVLIGIVESIPIALHIYRDYYLVGNNKYETLSSAAQAVSGNRRNGWDFWKTPSGQSVKEVYRGKTNG